MKRTITMLATALTLSVAAPAYAADPIPGVDISLGQVPGGRIMASAPTDASGTVSFFNLPAGRYEVLVGNCKLTKPAIAVVTSGRDKPITTDPIPVDRTPCGKTSSRGYSCAKKGGAITLVIPPNTGTPPNATPKAVSGPAPSDARLLSTIVVTLTTK